MSAIEKCIAELNEVGIRHAAAAADRLERAASRMDDRAAFMVREGWHPYAATCERASANMARQRAAHFRAIASMGAAA